MRRRRLTRICLEATLVLALAGTATAANLVGIQGGLFSPWDGDPGVSFAVDYAHRFRGRHYIGGELEYRNFEGEIFGVDDIDLQTFQIRAIYRYDLIVGSFITPYVGAGFGFGINTYDDDDVERALELKNPGRFYSAPSASAGFGFIGLLGLDLAIPGADRVSFFAEARVGYNAQFSVIEERNFNNNRSDDDEIEVDNLGGFTAHGGIRFHF